MSAAPLFRLRPIIFFAALSLSADCLPESGLALTGHFEYRTDPQSLEMLGGLVCFYPSAESAKLVPRPTSDRRLVWFCFTNKIQSKKLLGIPTQEHTPTCGLSGNATVRVVDYKPYLGEGDHFDTALLKSVSNLSNPKALLCQ